MDDLFDSPRKKIVMVRFSDNEYEGLQQIARKYQKAVSSTVRALVLKAIREMVKSPKTTKK